MQSDKTSMEITNLTIEKLGDEFGTLFNNLINEVSWIQFLWLEFNELFGKDEQRVNMLNKIAPDFFQMTQTILLESILLAITRITDPEESNIGGETKRNLTIKAIPKYIIDNPKFKKKINRKIEQIMDISSSFRDWRNRHIAHKDLILSIKNHDSKPLKTLTRQDIRLTVERFHQLFNDLEIYYQLPKSYFDLMIIGKSSSTLIYYLENGIKYQNDLFESKLLKG